MSLLLPPSSTGIGVVLLDEGDVEHEEEEEGGAAEHDVVALAKLRHDALKLHLYSVIDRTKNTRKSHNLFLHFVTRSQN